FLNHTQAGITGSWFFDLSGGLQTSIPDVSAWVNKSMNKPLARWSNGFTDSSGWNAVQYYATIGYPDVDGDGKADVCGRGPAALYCGLSSSTAFGGLNPWTTGFTDAQGWNAVQYYSTIKYPDIDGDGKADVCGRGRYALNCGLSSGTAFGGLSPWSTGFT